MAMTEQDGSAPGAAQPQSTQVSWPPGERMAGALTRPVTRGFALALTVVVIAVGGWGLHAQSEALDRVAQSVDQPPAVTSLVPSADPGLCWLVGADAHAAGRGPQLVRELGSLSLMTDCTMAAQQGAEGVPRSG